MKKGIIAFLLTWCMPVVALAFFHGGVLAGTLHTFGDCITAGFGATTPAQDYVSLISAGEALPASNFGVSGYQACDMTDLSIFPNENPGGLGSKNATFEEMIGVNDANVKGAGSYEAVYNQCLMSALSWLAVPSANKTVATACTNTGAWTADNTSYVSGLGLKVSASGATLSCSITTPSGVIYAWYRLCDSCGGTFTYTIDGGSPTTINNTTTPVISTQNGGTHGDGLIRITGLTSAAHTVLFTTTNSSLISILGVGTPAMSPTSKCCSVLADGVIQQYQDVKSTDTAAYNADVSTDASLLASDGLAVTFVNVRAFITGIQANMYDQLHPNNTGHALIAQANEAVWKNSQ